jgi:hypothetical protein
VTVMPVAVSCAIDAMVCTCVGSYPVLNWSQTFNVFTMECPPKFSCFQVLLMG